MPSSSAAVPESSLKALSELSDRELLAALSTLAQQERAHTVAVLTHLAEVERRGLHLTRGCSSLFAYCVQRLGFSEDVAYKRVGASRYGSRFPLALELIAQGALHLSALLLVGPQLTEENHHEWLMTVSGKSKREVEVIVATRYPKPDVASSVRRLPARPLQDLAPVALGTVADQSNATRATQVGQTQPGNLRASANQRPRVEPLSGSTYRIVFTAPVALKQKLDRARELCSHCVAPTDLPALFERALDLLLEHEERRRFAVHSPKGRAKEHIGATESRSSRSEQEPDPADLVDPARRRRGSDALVSEALRQDSDTLVDEAQRQDADTLVSEALRQDADTSVSEALWQGPDALAEQTTGPRAMVEERGSGALGIEAPRQDSGALADETQTLDCGASIVGRSASISASEFSRYVPAAVRRAVWERDGGQCTFVDDEGNRCTERRYLEIDHRVARARGGPKGIRNCRLLCKAHNQQWAKQTFGIDFVTRARSRAKA